MDEGFVTVGAFQSQLMKTREVSHIYFPYIARSNCMRAGTKEVQKKMCQQTESHNEINAGPIETGTL